MEFEPWYLLALPILFIAGWWARGFDARTRAADQGAAPNSMFVGLNLLLNDQPDKAIDAFIDVVKLDPETIELHFALGHLFRRRGEIDRAVRIHNYLLGRADLPREQRSVALGELGQDFLKGGMLDRAEEAFLRLLDAPTHRFEALRALLRVYQIEKEWAKAVDTARRLEREAGESHSVSLAHFFCELAEQALARKDFDAVDGMIDKALAADRKSVRAILLAGQAALRRDEPEAAVREWLKIDADAPEYLPLVAKSLAECLDRLGRRTEALNLLRRSLLDHPSIDTLDVAYERVAAWEGAPAAENLLRDELKKHPSLLGFERLLALRSAAAKGDNELDLLRNLINQQTRKLARYRCARCGFRVREYHWNCPGCSNWNSYPPRRIEELDAQN